MFSIISNINRKFCILSLLFLGFLYFFQNLPSLIIFFTQNQNFSKFEIFHTSLLTYMTHLLKIQGVFEKFCKDINFNDPIYFIQSYFFLFFIASLHVCIIDIFLSTLLSLFFSKKPQKLPKKTAEKNIQTKKKIEETKDEKEPEKINDTNPIIEETPKENLKYIKKEIIIKPTITEETKLINEELKAQLNMNSIDFKNSMINNNNNNNEEKDDSSKETDSIDSKISDISLEKDANSFEIGEINSFEVKGDVNSIEEIKVNDEEDHGEVGKEGKREIGKIKEDVKEKIEKKISERKKKIQKKREKSDPLNTSLDQRHLDSIIESMTLADEEETKSKKKKKKQKENSNNNFEEIDFSRFEIVKTLSSGGFGIVYLAQMKVGLASIKIALKEMKKANYSKLKHEVMLMKKLMGNKSILQCFGFTVKRNKSLNLEQYYIVLEYIEKGDLAQYYRKNNLTRLQKLRFLYNIGKAMRFLHSKNIIHRDLKPENILVVDEHHIKLCDFGQSKHEDLISQTLTGSMDYIAPEFLLEKKVKPKKVDIYSFGVLLYELWQQKKPFIDYMKSTNQNQYQILFKIHSNNIRPSLKNVNDMPSELLKLMKKCWDGDINKRPNSFQYITKVLKKVYSNEKKKQKK